VAITPFGGGFNGSGGGGGGTDPLVIVEITGSYLATVTDDIVSATIAVSSVVTLPPVAGATKLLNIKNAPTSTANVTITPDGSDTIEDSPQVLTVGQSLTIFPITGGWLII